jgi:hypothetical protein
MSGRVLRGEEWEWGMRSEEKGRRGKESSC